MPGFELLPDIYVPTFEMKVQDKPLSARDAKSILEISVTEHLNPPSEFSFRVNDPKLKFINKENGLFTEGTKVEISIGYVGSTRSMITGEISALTADFPSSGPATLHVQGFDLLHRLTRGNAYRKFDGSTPDSGLADSDVVSKVASDVGLQLSADSTATRTKPRVQNYKSNLAFLEELALANGYSLWVEGSTLHFKKAPPERKTIRLEWGKTLLSFSPRLTIAGQVNAIVVRGWDPIQKQSISSPSKVTRDLAATGQEQIGRGAGGKSELVIQALSVSSTQEAQALADKLLSDQLQGLITGNGTSAGEPEMQVGTVLDLRRVGRFSGNYVVQRVTHTVSEGGYQTSFEVTKQK